VAAGNVAGGRFAFVVRCELRVFRRDQHLPRVSAEHAAHDREDDEGPELTHRPAVLHERGGETAGGVHGGVVHRDRDEWITVSMSPTVTPVKPGDIDLRDVLAITKTNSPVKTISVRITAGSLKPPGECAP
jgi:hypothetical protein